MFHKVSGMENFYVQERGEEIEVLSKISFKIFCLTAENFSSATLQCATNFR